MTMQAPALQSTIPIPEPIGGRLPAIFRALDLSGDPFALNPIEGAFAPTSVHAGARTELLDWITSLEEDVNREERLGVVVGEDGTGKTRLLTELVDALGDGVKRTLISLPDIDEQATEAQMLRSIATGLGTTPTGRNGLELMGGIGEALASVQHDDRVPGLLIDGANFTGARLETIRNLLRTAAGTGLWIVLFATPDLLVRTNRRRSLRGLMGPRIELVPLSDEDANLLITSRIESVQTNHDREPLIDGSAMNLMIRWAHGNAAKLVQIAGESVVEAIAQGQSAVDERITQLVERELTDESRHRARAESAGTDITRPVQATMPLFSEDGAPRSSSATTQQGLWEDGAP